MSVRSTYFPLTELIEALKVNGFVISTGDNLRIQHVLSSIDFQENYDELIDILCPIIAKNPKQQTIFKDIFNVIVYGKQKTVIEKPYIKRFKGDDVSKEFIPEKQKFKWLIPIIISVALGISYFTWGRINDELNRKDEIENVTNNDSINSEVNQDALDSLMQGQNIEVLPEIIQEEAPGSLLHEQKIENNVISFKYTLALFIFLTFIGLQLLKKHRKKLIAKKYHDKKPPYVWSVKTKEHSISMSNDFFTVANNLRIRNQFTSQKIDVHKTISSIIKNPFKTEIVYQNYSKPSEYLMLIDQSNIKNHQAQLFDYYYHTLTGNNVYITRFYYNSDPRICWNSDYENGISLEKLQRTYPESFLLIFGNGSHFINHNNNELKKYIKTFKQWEKRALLTSTPSAQWGIKEVKLKNCFEIILPATTNGMLELTQYFHEKSDDGSDLKDWKYNKNKINKHIYVSADNLLDNTELPKPLKLWVAACAVYPELYWDLTLSIGNNISHKIDFSDYEYGELITQENIIRLSCIDWFKEGQIPDSERQKILGNEMLLPESIKNESIKTVIDVLTENLPKGEEEKQSIAYQKVSMNIVVSKLMLNNTKGKENRKLKEAFNQYLQSSEEQDFVSLEYVSKLKSGFSGFILPKSFHKYFFNNGLSILGVRKSVQYLSMFIFLFILFIPWSNLLYKTDNDFLGNNTELLNDSIDRVDDTVDIIPHNKPEYDLEKQNKIEAIEKARRDSIIALNKLLIAQNESFKVEKENALMTQNRAIQQQQMAVKEKELALQAKIKSDEARQKALIQEEKSQRLRLLSLAESMALKSKKITDKKTKALVAKQAFNFFEELDGLNSNTSIYDALYYAVKNLEGSMFNELSAQKSSVNKLLFIPYSQNTLLSLSKDGEILKWNLSNDNKNSYEVLFNGNKSRLTDISYDIENKSAIAVTSEGEVLYINDRGQIKKESYKSSYEIIKHSFIQDKGEGIILRVSRSKIGYVLEEIRNNYINELYTFNNRVNDIDISNDKYYIVTDKGEVILYDRKSKGNQTLYSSKEMSGISKISLSENGKMIVLGFVNGEVKIIDSNKGSVISSLSRHVKEISDIKFNRKGNMLATASIDKTVQLWDLKDLIKLPIELNDAQSEALTIEFSNDDRFIYVGYQDGTIRQYPIEMSYLANKICESATINRNLTEKEWRIYVSEDIEQNCQCEKSCNQNLNETKEEENYKY